MIENKNTTTTKTLHKSANHFELVVAEQITKSDRRNCFGRVINVYKIDMKVKRE